VKRIGLVGCAKEKRSRPTRASDMYVSPLFRARRDYVRDHCGFWFILSAAHGLLEPGQLIMPYDVTLNDFPASGKRLWAALVLGQLEGYFEPLGNWEFEIHAGADYRRYGLEAGLPNVTNPVEGLGIGQQLAFYKTNP
jgi:hypothetical protein